MYRYIEVAQEEIRPEKVEAALRMLAYSCKALEIPAPRMKWFAPADSIHNFKPIGSFKCDNNIWGLADHVGLLEHGGTIWIRGDLPTKETVLTVGHEVRHTGQFYSLPLRYYDAIDMEALADEFAEAMLDELWLHDDQSYLEYLTGVDFSEGRFKSKETAEARVTQRLRSNGGKRLPAIVSMHEEPWFQAAARRAAEAERLLGKRWW